MCGNLPGGVYPVIDNAVGSDNLGGVIWCSDIHFSQGLTMIRQASILLLVIAATLNVASAQETDPDAGPKVPAYHAIGYWYCPPTGGKSESKCWEGLSCADVHNKAIGSDPGSCVDSSGSPVPSVWVYSKSCSSGPCPSEEEEMFKRTPNDFLVRCIYRIGNGPDIGFEGIGCSEKAAIRDAHCKAQALARALCVGWCCKSCTLSEYPCNRCGK